MNIFLLESFVACALVGASSGLLGSFLLIRRRALMGDVIGHSVLPGLAAGFVLAGYRQDSLWLYCGALASALLAAALIAFLTRRTALKADAAMAVVLTGLYALGVSAMTWIQSQGGGRHTGLESFLLGQAATISRSSLATFAVFLALVVALLLLLRKEFLAATFDPLFSQTQGLYPRVFSGLLSALTACAVVLSLPAVGLVLASALLILPAAIANLLSKSLNQRLVLSASAGALLGFVGAFVSSRVTQAPTGPTLILTFTAAFLILALLKSLREKIRRARNV